MLSPLPGFPKRVTQIHPPDHSRGPDANQRIGVENHYVPQFAYTPPLTKRPRQDSNLRPTASDADSLENDDLA